MQKSATVLGQDYGLTGEEMNRALVKLGYLEGEPGNYSPTDKAAEYVQETDHHRGTGGYSWYNRSWTTRTFDDSIKDDLNITPELKQEIRNELAQVRAERSAARSMAQQQAEEASERTELETDERYEELIDDLKEVGKYGLALAILYGIYKIAPRVKNWWSKRKQKESEYNVIETEYIEDINDNE